jgi:hypothetical protein
LNAGELVYAISDGFCVKIGKTAGHPLARLKGLQCGSSRRLTLVAYSGGLAERRVHQKFCRWRTMGEWFKPAAAVLAELLTWDWCDLDQVGALRRASAAGTIQGDEGRRQGGNP